MNKKVVVTVFIAAALSLISCSTSPETPPSTAKEKLRKERTVIVKRAVLQKESVFYADGLLDQYIRYAYNPDFRILLEKTTWDSGRQDPVERVVSETMDGRTVAETSFDADGKLKLRHEYGWNAKGLLESERVLDAKGQIQSSSSYVYDSMGRKESWKVFDGNGVLKAVTAYSYSSGSQPTGIDLQNALGKSAGSIRLEYGKDGSLKKRSYLGSDGAVQKYEVYGYSGALGSPGGGLATIETRRTDSSLASKILYQRGELGQILVATSYDGTGQVREIRKYEYLVVDEPKLEVYYE